MKRLLSLVGAAAALVLLSACGPSGRYQYDLPKDGYAQACVAQCRMQKQQCGYLDDSKRRLQEARMDAYHYCVAGKDKRQARKDCAYPGTYGGYGSYGGGYSAFSSCADDYDQCFTSCGGTIRWIPAPTQ
ncbi:hypothetical protein NRL37_14450 [Metapseudomonas otitidis]|uniref:hypothetical protein n=1 Tax=Metapseudomonas otitidis TaxID=319939 RepID=UPI00227CC4FF|nr:hypothetical protein [Pseudomonas otitidis]WAF83318.1 hypothetical protein NRL37_14450 [Pseudomonas otitidis]